MKASFGKYALALALFASSTVVAEIPPPAALRTVQCGSFEAQAEADALKIRLSDEGFGPVWQDGDGGRIRVFAGRMERLTDAYLLKLHLHDRGFSDAFEKAFPNTAKSEFGSQFTTPMPRLLFADPASGKPFFSPASIVPFEENEELTAVASALKGGENVEAFYAVEDLIDELPDKDPLKGWAMVRLGRAMVQNSKRAENAQALFLRVARGEVAATAEDQMQARWLAADSWHYFLGDRTTAYRAYNEILAEYGRQDDGVRARAMVEVAACLLELAQAQKSYYNEVRRASRQILETVPRQYERAHAVADLLYCESWLFNGDKERALEDFQGFETRHPNRPREIAMANQMQGWMLAELGRWEEAVPYFERNLAMEFPPEERFYWKGEPWNLKRLSSKWLMHYAGKFEDAARQKQYAEYVDSAKFDEGVGALPTGFDFAFPHEFYQNTAARDAAEKAPPQGSAMAPQ